jgi:hypothetical protein
MKGKKRGKRHWTHSRVLNLCWLNLRCGSVLWDLWEVRTKIPNLNQRQSVRHQPRMIDSSPLIQSRMSFEALRLQMYIRMRLGLVSIAGMILLRHPYCQICTTLAPRPPAEIFLQRSRSEQSEHYTPGPVLSTSPPAHSEPFNYSAYLRNDWKSDKSAVPGVLTVRNAKRRSKTYGGLPVPEGWEDVDVNS